MKKLLIKYKNHIVGVCFTFTILMVLELWPLLGARTLSELRDTIPDEYSFMNTILDMKNYMIEGNFKGILQFGTPYGYGYFYWVLMGFFGLLIKGFEFPDQVLFFRSIGILFKALMIYCLFRSVERNSSTPMAILSVCFILSMPGFWFYGKVISPEFIVLGLISLSLYLLIRDKYQFKVFFWVSVIFLGLIINIKLSTFPVYLIWFMYSLSKFKLDKIKCYLIIFQLSIVMILSYFIFNITLITQTGRESFHKWMLFNKGNTHFPNWENTIYFYNLNSITWDRILNYGMRIDYINFFLFILLSAFTVWSLCRRFDYLKLSMIITSFIFITFVLSTQIYHSWYLMAPFLLFSYSIFYRLKNNKWNYYFISGLTLALIIGNFYQIIYKYEYRLAINNSMDKNYLIAQEIKTYIIHHGKAGDVILTNPFLALPNIDSMKTISNSDMLFDLVYFNQSLFLHYPDSTWILVDNKQGEGAGDWASWNKLITTGVEINGIIYKFTLDNEFSNSKLYRRVP